MNGILKLKHATLETEFVTDVMAAIGEDKFATKTDLTTKADKSEIESIKADLRDKANTADVVTKGEMDGAVATVNEAVALKANAQDVTNALAGKQATLTSEQLSAIAAVSGKADAHEVTAALNSKADAAHMHDTAYAKVQDVQDAIEGKQDKLPLAYFSPPIGFNIPQRPFNIGVTCADGANIAMCALSLMDGASINAYSATEAYKMPYADVANVEITYSNIPGTIAIGSERINVIQRDDATNTPITIRMPQVDSEINMPDYAVTFEVVLDYSRCTEGNTPETTFACRDENGDGEPDKEIHWLGGDGEPPDCSANKKHLLAFRWLMNDWLGCKQGEW